MFSFFKTAPFMTLTLVASAKGAYGSYQTGVACKPCLDSSGDCEVKVKINFFASETGRYCTADTGGLILDKTFGCVKLISLSIIAVPYRRIL